MAVTRITSSPARPRTTTRRALGVEGARLFDELPASHPRAKARTDGRSVPVRVHLGGSRDPADAPIPLP
jgi:hypothetical protein